MSGLSFPESWKAQMAIAAAVAFAGCWTLGYFSKPSGQARKNRQAPQGGMDQGPPGMTVAERKLERLFKTGEHLISQGNVAQAELAYIEALEVVQELPEPTIASFLETVLSTRVAQTCEKQGKYEEAEKYLLRAIAQYESRGNLSPQELPEYAEVLEKAVEICMTKLNNPEKAVRPLMLWSKLGEEMGSDQIVLVSSNLLGNIKAKQEKYEEAEAYCKKVITIMSKNGTLKHDELSASTMMNLSHVFFHLEKHEENKKLIQTITKFLGELGVMAAATATASLGENVFDYGYFNEALIVFQRALEHSGRAMIPLDEVAHIENCIAQTLAELGRIDDAKEKFRIMAIGFGNTVTPPLTVSQYFQTRDAVVEESNGTASAIIQLVQRTNRTNKKKVLPATAVLVCSIENPAGGEQIEQQQALSANPEFRIELPYAKKGYYLAQIDVYSDATKTQKLSTHLALTQCESDINLPVASIEPSASSSSSASEDVAALVAEASAFAAAVAPSSDESIPVIITETATIITESSPETPAESKTEIQTSGITTSEEGETTETFEHQTPANEF